MIPSIPDSDAFNWIIGPQLRLVEYVTEETRIAGLLQKAVVALRGQKSLIQVARQQARKARLPDGPYRKILEFQETLGPWADELILDDYQPINAHATVGLWVATEVAIEDTAVLIMLKEPAILADVAASGCKLPDLDEGVLSERQARRLFKKMETRARNSRSVAEAYCEVLGILKVPLVLQPHQAVLLTELNYVRNAILHRGGLADDRCLVEAAALGLASGNRISISSAAYLKYFEAVSHLAIALIEAVRRSPYLRGKPVEASAP